MNSINYQQYNNENYNTNVEYLENGNDTKSIKTITLSETDKLVNDTIVMRLTEKESLEYLADHGFKMSRAKYYRHKKKLEDTKFVRLDSMIKYGFTTQHLQKIDKLEFIEKQMWKDYFDCKDPYKRVEILTQIANLQPFLSAYYDSTRYVLERSEKRNLGNNYNDIPTAF